MAQPALSASPDDVDEHAVDPCPLSSSLATCPPASTPYLANPSTEEPDAVAPHVRIRGGPGCTQGPGLPDFVPQVTSIGAGPRRTLTIPRESAVGASRQRPRGPRCDPRCQARPRSRRARWPGPRA